MTLISGKVWRFTVERVIEHNIVKRVPETRLLLLPKFNVRDGLETRVIEN